MDRGGRTGVGVVQTLTQRRMIPRQHHILISMLHAHAIRIDGVEKNITLFLRQNFCFFRLSHGNIASVIPADDDFALEIQDEDRGCSHLVLPFRLAHTPPRSLSNRTVNPTRNELSFQSQSKAAQFG